MFASHLFRSNKLHVANTLSVYSRGFRASSLVSAKKTVDELAQEITGGLKSQRVLVRVDFNVPFNKKDGTISDDTRIRESLPTIKFLSNQGCKVVLASHCGRPGGKVVDSMRMAPIAERLGQLLGRPVQAVDECIGPKAEAAAAKLQNGEILMLENVRFHKEEEKNDAAFAEKLAKMGTIYVNDAFGTAHRAHASTAGVAAFMKHKVAGYLMAKELIYLKNAVDAPKRPFAAIIGGAKVSTKIPVLNALVQKCDKILLGGGMIFTFYRAMGLKVGSSMVEEDFIPMANDIIQAAKKKGVKLILPVDVVLAEKFTADSASKISDIHAIPDGWMGLDIGPHSITAFKNELHACKTVVWNGPMGVFEFEKFAQGTNAIASCLAQLTEQHGATTIIGGGDSVAAVAAANLQDKMSHISTGGGASLEMLEGIELPGVAVLDEAKK